MEEYIIQVNNIAELQKVAEIASLKGYDWYSGGRTPQLKEFPTNIILDKDLDITWTSQEPFMLSRYQKVSITELEGATSWL